MRPQLLYLQFLCAFSFPLFSPQKWILVVFIHKLNLCLICVVECLHAWTTSSKIKIDRTQQCIWKFGADPICIHLVYLGEVFLSINWYQIISLVRTRVCMHHLVSEYRMSTFKPFGWDLVWTLVFKACTMHNLGFTNLWHSFRFTLEICNGNWKWCYTWEFHIHTQLHMEDFISMLEFMVNILRAK